MPAAAFIPVITAGVGAASSIYAANKQASSVTQAAKTQTDAANHAADTTADSAKYAADLQAKAQADALAFQKQQAADALAQQQAAQYANYQQWRARASAVAAYAKTLGLQIDVPEYAGMTAGAQAMQGQASAAGATADRTATGTGTANTATTPTLGLTPPAPPQRAGGTDPGVVDPTTGAPQEDIAVNTPTTTGGVAPTTTAPATASTSTASTSTGTAPSGGNLRDPAYAKSLVDYYATQPGVNPSLKRDPNYWIGKITSGELGSDESYIVKRFMQPEGPPMAQLAAMKNLGAMVGDAGIGGASTPVTFALPKPYEMPKPYQPGTLGSYL